MKKIILLMSVLAIVNTNAKSRSEMIRQDLSKLGVSQEIILKTIELAKTNKNDFYNNKKIFQKNLDKIRMLD